MISPNSSSTARFSRGLVDRHSRRRPDLNAVAAHQRIPGRVPPTVVVKATYPGAQSKVIAETVSAPWKNRSTARGHDVHEVGRGSDGTLQMTITFRPGTDPSKAQVDVQTVFPRPCRACLRRWSASARDDHKQSPAFLVLVTLISDGRYDALYLRNYANIRVKDQIAACPASERFSNLAAAITRCELARPDRVASRGSPLRRRARDPGAEPASLGRPARRRADQGRRRLPDRYQRTGPAAFGRGVRQRRAQERRERRGRSPRRRGAHRARRQRLYDTHPTPTTTRLRSSPCFRRRAPIRWRRATRDREDERVVQALSTSLTWRSDYDSTIFVRESIEAVVHTLLEAIALVVLVVILFLQTWRASIIQP